MPRIFAVALAILSLLAMPCALHAQDPQTGPAPPAVAPPATRPTDPTAAATTIPPPPPRAIANARDLSAYVDGLVDQAMERDGIAGVTVAIVDRDGPLLLRGYGIADQQPRRKVDPRRTLFRIASISKTFTYLLGLKLVDDGRIKLDAPVNDYLPPELQLPDDGYAPVRVRHLFTHTAGFEDSAFGHLFVDRADRVITLGEYLRRHRPLRVREPGTHAVYSNYSVALLGALVTHLTGTDPGSGSGASFDALVERELFDPMAMRHTTFREPLRAGDPRDAGKRFAGMWSQGFKRESGGFKAQTFEHIAQVGPAGGASSTAEDMGRYMRMLLRGGELDGVRVLSPSAYVRLRDETLFRNAPEVGGFSYGFFRTRVGQVEALGHGGATSWFHSGMTVVPELGVGIFVSTNTDSGRKFAGQFAEKVLERYFARARAAAPPAVPKGFDASRFAGSYNAERGNYSSAEKLFLSMIAEVTAAEDNSLVISVAGESSRWVPDGALSFREVEGQSRIAFFADDDGRITGFASAGGHNVFERVGFFDVGNHLLLALGLTAITALLVLTGAWLRRKRRIRDQPRARFSALWLYLTTLLWLAVLVLVALFADYVSNKETELFYHYPGSLLTTILWLVLAPMAATVICVPLLWPAWGANDWGFWRKLRHTLAVAVFALTTWLLWHWNLVGWKL
jgi:CubicO group peptidase (beta-lactamase class C family)